MEEIEQIPVIDIFAGPGGLGEGFSSFRTRDGCQPFRISLSVEKDPRAHETLKLRSFLRQFPVGAAPEEYYQVLRGELKLEDLPERLQNKPDALAAWNTAEREAVCAELGASEESHKIIGSAIRKSVKNRKQPWVLIGGPPCQAYSIAGRARNKGIADYRIEDDHRSSLYQEYHRRSQQPYVHSQDDGSRGSSSDGATNQFCWLDGARSKPETLQKLERRWVS